jgi:hypothetical protein
LDSDSGDGEKFSIAIQAEQKLIGIKRVRFPLEPERSLKCICVFFFLFPSRGCVTGVVYPDFLPHRGFSLVSILSRLSGMNNKGNVPLGKRKRLLISAPLNKK